ncbi:hypothetical protein FACS1894184_16400 [Clostridia bacterium]|nr:hypothetical protein FACS1894184_16400 [Clostridia bacterium]
MLAYYGSKISEHMTTTPEGFLICQHVPIARTGTYEYRADELGLEGERMVKVHRTPEEVFNNTAIASFESKPVTLGHPFGVVTPDNANAYIKGHVRNIKRGIDDEDDLLIADLVITDASLITQIKEGLREVSCGYDCLYDDNGSGYMQTQIRGNHVAVVEQGRAGDRVAIRDAAPPIAEPNMLNPKTRTIERSTRMNKDQKSKKGHAFGSIFRLMAKDAEPEVIEAASELAEALVENAETTNVVPDEAPAAPAPATSTDEDGGLNEIKGMIAQLATSIEALAAKIAHDEEKEANPLDELAQEIGDSKDSEETEEKAADEESAVIPQDEEPEPAASSADSKAAIIAAIDAIKPVIAQLPADKRRSAADAAAKSLRKAYGKPARTTDKANIYASMNASRASTADKQRVTDSAPDTQAQIGKEIMAKYNPHYKKA